MNIKYFGKIFCNILGAENLEIWKFVVSQNSEKLANFEVLVGHVISKILKFGHFLLFRSLNLNVPNFKIFTDYKFPNLVTF